MSASVIEPIAAVRRRTDSFREQFATRRRVVIENLLEPDVSTRIANEMVSLPFVPVVNVPVEGGTTARPWFWHYQHIVEVDSAKKPTNLEALVLSMTRGAVRDLVGAIVGYDGLRDKPTRTGPALVAYAYPRGGYVEAHSDAGSDDGWRRCVAMVFHASPRWQSSWGGELHFVASPEETYSPSFGALHLFDVGASNRHEVTMVTGPETRYTLSGWLFEPPS
jgi:hypothetical protein